MTLPVPSMMAWCCRPLAVGARLLDPERAPSRTLEQLGGLGPLAAAWSAALGELLTRLEIAAGAGDVLGAHWTAVLRPCRGLLAELAAELEAARLEPALAAALDLPLTQRDGPLASAGDLELAAWLRGAEGEPEALDEVVGALADPGRLRGLLEVPLREAWRGQAGAMAALLLAERLGASERERLLAGREDADELAAALDALAARHGPREFAAREWRELPDASLRLQARRESGRELREAALARRQAGDLEGALAALDEALAADDRDAAAWLMLAELRWHAGEWGRGLAAYEQGVAIDPSRRLTPQGIRLIAARPGGPLGISFLARSGDAEFDIEPLPAHLVSAERLTQLEARCARLAAAEHADLVRCQVLRHGGRVMLVSSAAPTRTLADELRDGALDAERMLAVASSVADQLASLHATGLAHGRLDEQAIAVEWPRVRLTRLALTAIQVLDAIAPSPQQDLNALGQLLIEGLGSSCTQTTIHTIHAPLVELLARLVGPPANRPSAAEARDELDAIRTDPGLLEILELGE